MTVIAALRCPEAFFITADTQATLPGLTYAQAKLEYIEQPFPLAWGFAGADDLGIEFGRRLRLLSWSGVSDWYSFRDVVAPELARINGAKRRLVRLARAKLTEYNLVQALVVGFINGKGAMFAMDEDGNTAFDAADDFMAIGTGKNYAIVAMSAIRAVLAQMGASYPLEVQRLQVATAIAAAHAPDCSLPLSRTLEVTRAGVRPAVLQVELP